MTDEEKFIEQYKKVFDNIDHQNAGGAIIIHAEWVDPKRLRPGKDHVMFLPLEVTEHHDMVPRVARVRRINREKGAFIIITDLGIMRIPEHEQIQAIV